MKSLSLIALIEEHNCKVAAFEMFLKKMIDHDLYKALYQHEQYIKTLKNVLSCTCCSIQFIEKKKIKYKNFNKVLEVFMK